MKTSQSICLHDASLCKTRKKKLGSQAAGDHSSLATKKNDNEPKTPPVRHERMSYLFLINYCRIMEAMPCIRSIMRIEKASASIVKYLWIDAMFVFRAVLAQMSLLFADKAACKIRSPCR